MYIIIKNVRRWFSLLNLILDSLTHPWCSQAPRGSQGQTAVGDSNPHLASFERLEGMAGVLHAGKHGQFTRTLSKRSCSNPLVRESQKVTPEAGQGA